MCNTKLCFINDLGGLIVGESNAMEHGKESGKCELIGMGASRQACIVAWSVFQYRALLLRVRIVSRLQFYAALRASRLCA